MGLGGRIAAMAAGAAAWLALGGAAAAPDPRARLILAKQQAAIAAGRAAALEQRAQGERDQAAKARVQREAVAARVTQAEADIVTARARLAVVSDLLAQQRGRLAIDQAPVAHLLAALQSLARRPSIVAVAQPGSVDDLVHVRAVLGSALPIVAQRTAGIRAEVDQTRRLRAGQALAAGALADGRAQLVTQRQVLAALEQRHASRSLVLGRSAIGESDRAIALGEQARDIADQIAAAGGQQATEADLRTLPAPPTPPVAEHGAGPTAYRLPVTGRLVTGLGEISDAGVRSRGLTLAVAPGAAVSAPAAGTIVYARPFRGYGTIVIIDHGAGWTSLLTGLADTSLARGQQVVAGEAVGHAGSGDDPAVTVELRRRGRAVDITALL